MSDTTPLPELKMPLDALAIRKILPHRYPFLLIDRVIAMEPGQTISAIKCITQNEPFFQGHFPGQPIMPGVLQIEAMAQAGAVLLLTHPSFIGKLAVLTGVEEFKFRRQVVPGDVVRIDIYELKTRKVFGKARGRMTIDGDLVCEGLIGFALVDPAKD